MEQRPLSDSATPPVNPPSGGIFRLIAGVTGASGSIYGWRLLEKLRARPNVELHLILSRAGERTAFLETGKQAADFRALADCWHPVEDISSPLASGSFRTDAMVIAPCSIHTMSSIAAGISSNLMIRAADVTLKQRRPLVLMVRETPLHLGHLRSLAALAEMGAIIAPPVPAFYHRPQTVAELVDDSVDRVLDLLGLAGPEVRRWEGPDKGPAKQPAGQE
ncbi:MAG TPA: UbiX family flavin prenyltransferase [Bryobacteraceae bacterium]|nr:UbiX family flavin prenyltransferase [Bryobacteraceae bacterium]